MEARKSAKERIIRMLENRFESILVDARRIDTDTDEAFFRHKADLCKKIVRAIPLNNDACPFCVRTGTTCNECAYGDVNGRCRDDGSVFQELCNARTALIESFDDYAKVPDVEKERPHVELQVVDIKEDSVTFKIASQNVRNFPDFNASNGVRIASISKPEVRIHEDMFFVRGHYSSSDDAHMVCSIEDYLRILIALKEFNNG